MSAWMIVALTAGWIVGWIATAAAMFCHEQRKYPDIAHLMREDDAKSSVVICLFGWPIVIVATIAYHVALRPLLWLLHNTAGRLVTKLGDACVRWRP